MRRHRNIGCDIKGWEGGENIEVFFIYFNFKKDQMNTRSTRQSWWSFYLFGGVKGGKQCQGSYTLFGWGGSEVTQLTTDTGPAQYQYWQIEGAYQRLDMDIDQFVDIHGKAVLWVDSGGRPESGCSEEGRSRINGIWKRVTGRTWLQLMCCAHSYDWVCPIISGRRSEARVGWWSERRELRGGN